MTFAKPFPRVWLFWWKWGALQAYWYPCVSFGIHIDPRRPLVDIHFLVFTLSIGPAAHISGQEERHRQSCRGFLFADDIELCVGCAMKYKREGWL